MVDSTFFSKKKSFTLAELAEIGDCDIFPQNIDKDIIINDVGPIDSAKNGEITFVTNIYGKYQEYLEKTQASACIVDKKSFEKLQIKIPLLVSSNPYKSYALIAQSFYPREAIEAEISSQASIDLSAKIGKKCRIEDFAKIGKNACIGHNTIIESNVYIGPNVVIGDNCIIKANSVIQYSLIGNNVIIHPGVKIGQDGFGFASDREGHTLVPQLGRVIICDDVNIGANSCIDRGALNDTIIGKGTQIDNLVQIGHNVEIGMNCIIVSQVGIAGSTKIGDFVVIGGQVGIAGHLKIGSGAQIAAKSGVAKDVEPGKKIGGIPAISLHDWKRQIFILKSLIKSEE